jgi:hypothetical protein
MHPVHLAPSIVFLLSWLGAFGAWTTGAWSLARVLTDGSSAAIEGHRALAYRALALSVTFVVSGFLAGMAGGLFSHFHI